MLSNKIKQTTVILALSNTLMFISPVYGMQVITSGQGINISNAKKVNLDIINTPTQVELTKGIQNLSRTYKDYFITTKAMIEEEINSISLEDIELFLLNWRKEALIRIKIMFHSMMLNIEKFWEFTKNCIFEIPENSNSTQEHN